MLHGNIIVILSILQKIGLKLDSSFKKFKKSNFYQPNNIIGQKIKSIGLVAGFDDFKSDICLGEIGFF